MDSVGSSSDKQDMHGQTVVYISDRVTSYVFVASSLDLSGENLDPVDLFIDPDTCSAVSGAEVNKQPANQHRNGRMHSSGFSTEKLKVCQFTILAHYLVVSEITDTFVYIYIVDLTFPVRRTKYSVQLAVEVGF